MRSRGTGRSPAGRAATFAVTLALAAGLLPAEATAGAASAPSASRGAPATATSRAAPKPIVRTNCSTVAFAGNRLLGPKRLPNAGPVARLLRGWQRLAEFSPRGYLKLFYDRVARSWRYPPQGGYALTPLGVPIAGPSTLVQGQIVDRFGSEGGTYLSPAGTPYAARGIPPESLNPFPGGEPCNYYRYRVLKPFSVNAGPIAPALGQPGFGLQYVLSNTLFAGVSERVNVTYLLANGYVERVPYAPSRRPAKPPVPAA
jgi:Tuberculosis necrotizing toxin